MDQHLQLIALIIIIILTSFFFCMYALVLCFTLESSLRTDYIAAVNAQRVN